MRVGARVLFLNESEVFFQIAGATYITGQAAAPRTPSITPTARPNLNEDDTPFSGHGADGATGGGGRLVVLTENVRQ